MNGSFRDCHQSRPSFLNLTLHSLLLNSGLDESFHLPVLHEATLHKAYDVPNKRRYPDKAKEAPRPPVKPLSALLHLLMILGRGLEERILPIRPLAPLLGVCDEEEKGVDRRLEYLGRGWKVQREC